jgi:glycerophosphoryl diester phosphodiesterase
MAEDIQRDPSQVGLVKNKDQVIFAWTDAKNDARTIKILKELGVHGVIYDRYLSYMYFCTRTTDTQ